MGREECRTFVLGEQVKTPETVFLIMLSKRGGGSIDMFGSANIEGWLQLQLANQVHRGNTYSLYLSACFAFIWCKKNCIRHIVIQLFNYVATVNGFILSKIQLCGPMGIEIN